MNSCIILCLTLLIESVCNVKAQNEKEGDRNGITVQITATGFKNNSGQAILNIFSSSDGFPSNFSKVYRTVKGRIIQNKITFNVELPAGVFAFSCVHDENANNEMEKNILGIPKEGAGLSNYSQGGYPSYNKAKVHITANTSIQVKINYL